MFDKILIANRGEISIRISQACANLGVQSVAVYSTDDKKALHVSQADYAVEIPAFGVTAYLDQNAMIQRALDLGCDAIHPGYGFLAENATFARACKAAGLVFIGPSPATLEQFGDKTAALAAADAAGVATLASLKKGATKDQLLAFFDQHAESGIMIKAVAGGGGRGMRAVRDRSDLAAAWERCASEAKASFGSSDVYAEQLVGRARHVEVQIVGDGEAVTHFFERECSLQRRHQKLMEIAPSPWLEDTLRSRLLDAAVRIGKASNYYGVGTVEFLVELDSEYSNTGNFYFIELNPRIQVEHTVTEEVTGVDLVAAQIKIAAGVGLSHFGWKPPSRRKPVGYAVQTRVNMERVDPQGRVLPGSGQLARFDLPFGPNVRVETLGYQGLVPNLTFDPLLAKVIAYSPGSFIEAVSRAQRALGDFRIVGIDTNIALMRALLANKSVANGNIHTEYFEEHFQEVFEAAEAYCISAETQTPDDCHEENSVFTTSLAPLEGHIVVNASLQGRIVSFEVAAGDTVREGDTLCVIEAMKMEHVVTAPESGVVISILLSPDDAVRSDTSVLVIEPGAGVTTGNNRDPIGVGQREVAAAILEVEARRAELRKHEQDYAGNIAAEREAKTARQRIGMLVDPDTFHEFGSLASNDYETGFAPADGVVTGQAMIDGRSVMIVSQDFSVYGGSVGHVGLKKIDRAACMADRYGVPLIFLLDGGGHRIQDGQSSRAYAEGAALFQNLISLSGWTPIVAAVLGAGFAANTNFAACADFVVMERSKAVMGIAGPALVAAGTGEGIDAMTLGGARKQVDEYGLAHLGVEGEDKVFQAIRTYLSFLPSNSKDTVPVAPNRAPAKQGDLDTFVPANTRRSYDVHEVIKRIVDQDSFFEIKPTFSSNIVCGFARLGGLSIGVIANQPMVKGGMLDAPACEKAAHFISVCDAFGVPLLFLVDVPGFAIGSLAERTMLGRRSARMLHEVGKATVPRISVVMRKGYGLAYVAMAGGRSFESDLALAWPTAEICAMSVEGAVDVVYRKEINSSDEPNLRRSELVADMRKNISPLKAAEGFGIDDVIDPADTRKRVLACLKLAPRRRRRRERGSRTISPI